MSDQIRNTIKFGTDLIRNSRTFMTVRQFRIWSLTILLQHRTWCCWILAVCRWVWVFGNCDRSDHVGCRQANARALEGRSCRPVRFSPEGVHGISAHREILLRDVLQEFLVASEGQICFSWVRSRFRKIFVPLSAWKCIWMTANSSLRCVVKRWLRIMNSVFFGGKSNRLFWL